MLPSKQPRDGARSGRTTPHRRLAAWALAGVAALVGLRWAGEAVYDHLRAAAVLLEVVDLDDPTGLVGYVRHSVREEDSELRAGDRSLRARHYVPEAGGNGATVMLIHGVHPRGIDEAHLRQFARALASVGLDVWTPELSELLQYRVEPGTISDIRACAAELVRRGGRPVGAFGISFGGGLLLLAAAQDQGRLFDYVVAVGAHDDLERLARYYAGRPVEDPDGSRLPPRPDPYGARVIVRAHAEHFFSPADVAPARRAIGDHLAQRYAAAKRELAQLSPEGQARLRIVLDGERFAQLGDMLMEQVQSGALDLRSVSPRGHLASLTTPTYLIHGLDDPVIPSVETRWLARDVPGQALRSVLITPVLRHTELSAELSKRAYWDVLHFVARILEEAEN